MVTGWLAAAPRGVESKVPGGNERPEAKSQLGLTLYQESDGFSRSLCYRIQLASHWHKPGQLPPEIEGSLGRLAYFPIGILIERKIGRDIE